MYFFYIDESGSRDPQTRKIKADGSTVAKDHLYVLTAVALYERRWSAFERAIAGEKLDLIRRLYRDHSLRLELADCEVKSVWLRNQKQRESQSRFLSELVDAERTHLARTYYQQLTNQRMHIFSVVVDKRELHDHMDHLKLHKKAYELLLERIEQYLAEYHPKHQGVIVMDDTDKTINRALTMKHAWFQRAGNSNIRFNHIVEYPFFTDSKLSNGVQIADLCGYNVYRAFHDRDFSYQFFVDQLPHFYRSSRTAQGKVDGMKVWPETSPLVTFAQEGWQAHKQKQPGA
jgi:hypothetical protein